MLTFLEQVAPMLVVFLALLGLAIKLSSMLGRLLEGQEALKEFLAVFRQETREEFKAQGRDIRELRAKVDGCATKEEMRAGFKAQGREIGELRAKVDVCAKDEAVREKFAELRAKVDGCATKGEMREGFKAQGREIGELRAKVDVCAKDETVRQEFGTLRAKVDGHAKEAREEFKAVREEMGAAASGLARYPRREFGRLLDTAAVRDQPATPEGASRYEAKSPLAGDVAAENSPLRLTPKGKGIAAMARAAEWADHAADYARRRIRDIEEGKGEKMSPYEVQQFCFDFADSFDFDKVWTRRIQDTAFEKGKSVGTVLGVMALELRDVLLDMRDDRKEPEPNGGNKAAVAQPANQADAGVAEAGAAAPRRSRKSVRSKSARGGK